MKAYEPFIYGRRETRKLAERAKTNPVVQAIYGYIAEQKLFIDQYRDTNNPNKIKISGFLRVGFHIHFPEIKGWHNRGLKRFNPDKLEDLARAARVEGFDIIAVSNKYDDQVFGHEPGVEFDFPEGHIVVLKAQETGHVMPFGYRGRIRTSSLDDVVNSTLDQGGLYLLCHPSNRAYHGTGEAIAELYRETAILETSSPLVNHPLLNFSYADVIAKEWSLRHRIPGVAVLDARRYLFGGFFVPENIGSADFSSAENAMNAFAVLFQLRRNELARTASLKSEYIINTESYPRGIDLLEESTTSVLTSFHSKLIRTLFNAFNIKDKNSGLKNFDYYGKMDDKLEIFDGQSHVYPLNGQNPGREFAADGRQNLVFYRRGGKFYVGTSFGNAQAQEDNNLESILKSFNPAQTEFFRETIADGRFQEFKTGLHQVYPIACITPDGEKYVFVGKEFLAEYTKGDWFQNPFFKFYNRFILKGTEALRLASIQSTLLEKGLNVIPPLYVEFFQGRGRIISPYYRLESVSADYSNATREERMAVLEKAADHLARTKSRGVYLTDMHLGNIADEKGNWFEERDGSPIIPDINVAGTSMITFGDGHHNLVNPLSLLFSPRISFILKARRNQHKLVQGLGDVSHFLESYRNRLGGYTDDH